MLDLTTVALFPVGVVFALTYLYWKGRVPPSLPPGPPGLPFIGHLGLIAKGKKLHVITDEWGKQYGGLFSK